MCSSKICLLLGVGGEDHDDVGPRSGIGDRLHGEPGVLGLGLRRRTVAKTDAHLDTRLLQVERVGVALRAVADDGDLLAADDRRVGICLVVHVGGHQPTFPFVVAVFDWRRRCAPRSSLGSATRPVRCSSTMP